MFALLFPLFFPFDDAVLPDPPAAEIPGVGGFVTLIMSWLKTGTLVGGAIALVVAALGLFFSHQRGESLKDAATIFKVLLGVAIGLGATRIILAVAEVSG